MILANYTLLKAKSTILFINCSFDFSTPTASSFFSLDNLKIHFFLFPNNL